MSQATNIKLSAIAVVFLVSMLGAIVPMLLSRRYSISELLSSAVFVTFKCVATGVVLGVATMHLLPESIEVLETQSSYPRKRRRYIYI
jgi:putative Ca2+/H+ antiporter (TMEM165/GDT1 family)